MSGVGKSRTAREIAKIIESDKEPFLKSATKWWDGYDS